ncbi:MAG: hypothetical protein HY919_05590 [Elusimicrobia bacterium]|nr:hypothetical protein [Elusimicrobiota bacterium]
MTFCGYLDNRFYTDKAPGLSFLAVPFYAVFRLVGFPPAPSPIYRRIFCFLFSAVPTMLLIFFITDFLESQNIEIVRIKTIIIGYSLATLAFPFSMVFYPYQLVSFLLFAAFCFIYNNRNYFLSGLMCGFAAISDYTVFPVLLLFLIYILSHNRKLWLNFTLGLIPFIGILSIYNWLCFGNFFTLGYSYEFVPQFRLEMGKGLFGIANFSVRNFLEIIIKPSRGLFFYSPWLILAIFDIKKFYKQSQAEFFLFCTIILYFVALGAAYWDVSGGEIIGPRFLIPMLPFLISFVAFVKPKKSGLLYFLIGISFLIFFAVVSTDIHLPGNDSNPVLNYVLPKIAGLEFILSPTVIILYIVFLIGMCKLVFSRIEVKKYNYSQ